MASSPGATPSRRPTGGGHSPAGSGGPGPGSPRHGEAPERGATALAALDALTRRLRAECPWDREQDARTIVPHTLEEAYELADAVERDDDGRVLDELGDVLFQVHFLALLLEERGAGSLTAVADHVRAKLVRRHPHVIAPGPDADAAAAPTTGPAADARAPTRSQEGYTDGVPEPDRAGAAPDAANPPGDAPVPADAAGVLAQWDRVKATEPGREPGVFGEVPETLPALLHARKLQRRASASGLPAAPAEDLLGVVRDRLDALEAARAAGDRRGGADALGDALFALVGVARDVRQDPEIALRGSSGRFRRAVEAAEAGAAAEGRDWAQLTDDERLARYAAARRGA